MGFEAAERVTKSREVDLSRLKGFHLRFTPKMWRDLQLVSLITFGMAESVGSTPKKTIERVCICPAFKEQICSLSLY